MFSVGEYVVHRSNGICKVTKVAPLPAEMGGDEKRYYFLTPLNARGEVFTPAEEDNANIRKVMTKKEALKLIDEVPFIEDTPIDNDKQREAHYKEAIRSNDCKELVKIIKTLYNRRMARFAVGKKSTASEDRYFKQAEDNLYSELAFAIGKDRENVKELFVKKAQMA
ncbi:MAG: CarD family transcriptional regulator [Lachnospiraceae bacterium]|nr:CarD family transcriptional regulator [Lachnospiraceae bacterium]